MNHVDRLREISTTKQITQEQIAFALGVSVSTINRWFKGRFSPSVHIAPKIEGYLKRIG